MYVYMVTRSMWCVIKRIMMKFPMDIPRVFEQKKNPTFKLNENEKKFLHQKHIVNISTHRLQNC